MARRDTTMYMREQWPTESREPMEIVARESVNEKGSVEDTLGNCTPCEPPSAEDTKDEAEEPLISHSDTEPTVDKDSMCDREDDKDAEQELEEIREETVRRSVSKGFTKISEARPRHSRIQDRY